MKLDELGALPAEAKATCRRLLLEPLSSREMLRLRLEAYMRDVRAEAERREFFDLGLAERIAASLSTLIAELDGDPSEHQRIGTQLAVLYFITVADGEPDFESILGFEDDARVLNAILEGLGRHGLKVQI